MRTLRFSCLFGALIPGVLCAQGLAGSACVTVHPAEYRTRPEGRQVVQDVSLSSAVATYTLRYEIVEKEDTPDRVGFSKWAPTLGYTPLGIASPSAACWYNQGFFVWTLDDRNIQDYRAPFRVLRSSAPDAMVEYTWDTPKAVVSARFALAPGSDKLLFFGRYEPKEPVKTCTLRLMAYPATFAKPHVRTMTTAVRTLAGGTARLDPGQERWLLLEDMAEGRTADGSAGLLLGDVSAFSQVEVSGIGGYATYVDIQLAPGRRDFALALYEFPALPDPLQTRRYFQQSADVECAAVAAMNGTDLASPLGPLPVPPDRRQAVQTRDRDALARPAEKWSSQPDSPDFPWARSVPGQPVRIALLCPRWAAYETTELASRMECTVQNQYFDQPDSISTERSWPYARATGIGTLGPWLATKEALRICTEPQTEVFVVSGIAATKMPEPIKVAILEAVQAGKGLFLAGNAKVLRGWPKALTANPHDDLIAPLLESMPWEEIPGLKRGDFGRITEGSPWRAYRYGKGRVVVFEANLGRYSALVPMTDVAEGLEGATDRILALQAQAIRLAAGRLRSLPMRCTVAERPVLPGEPFDLVFEGVPSASSRLNVRIQDGADRILFRESLPVPADGRLPLPGLPAGPGYHVDMVAVSDQGETLAMAGTVATVEAVGRIDSVRLAPATIAHESAPPRVELPGGGRMLGRARISGLQTVGVLSWTVHDCLGRRVAEGDLRDVRNGVSELTIDLPRPMAIAHYLDVWLGHDGRNAYVLRKHFTVTRSYPYDDFTVLLWSYARGETVTRRVQRACYDLGTDMMDLCHIGSYSDVGAAREYAVASRSGLWILPYVTRLAFDSREDHTLKPGLFETAWFESRRESMAPACRQAAPYSPPAYTLGDENYMSRGKHEFGAAPETMAAYRTFLRERYGTIDRLNAVWQTDHPRFAAIGRPVWLEEAAALQDSYASWFDHRDFLDTGFARAHETLADMVREQDPRARVGWDGFLRYHWQAGYDFDKLTRNLELNQAYSSHPLQGELIRSLAGAEALTGEWGNQVADNEAGFSAIGWHNLFRGHNSVWWWTSWGCDYIPFNPDGSVSHMGEWFFRSMEEIKSGPGKLLVHASRDPGSIAILYNQADIFAAKLVSQFNKGAAFAGDGKWIKNHEGLRQAIEDLGHQCTYVAAGRLAEDPTVLRPYQVLVLPFATCLSERLVKTIRTFVEAGGSVVADGRTGLLSGNGVVQARRSLGELFGVTFPEGDVAFRAASGTGVIGTDHGDVPTSVLEPGVQLTTGQAQFPIGETPALIASKLGKGRAFFLNVPFSAFSAGRARSAGSPLQPMLGDVLSQAGCRPYCELRGEKGAPRCIEQTLFVEGNTRYLCLQQDIMLPGLADQDAEVVLPEPALVYDVRAGQPVGAGPVSSWPVRLSRGQPLLYALLPYRVTELSPVLAPTAALGGRVDLRVRVIPVAGEAGFHVVHVAVYAPGSERKHREYSQSIECPAGEGTADFPLALSDSPGKWRLVFRDVASGTTVEKTVTVADL